MNKLLIQIQSQTINRDIIALVFIQMQIRCQLDCSMPTATAEKSDLSILDESISQHKFADGSTNI